MATNVEVHPARPTGDRLHRTCAGGPSRRTDAPDCAGRCADDAVSPPTDGDGRRRGILAPSRRAFRFLSAVLACLLIGVVLPAAGQVKTLRVVGDDNYPPYLFLDPDGNPDGYLVDLWNLWSRRTGVPVRLDAIRWADAQQRILAGDADVIDMIFRTPDREPKYRFSKPYADLPVVIFADAAIGGLHDVRSLAGFKVGVQEGDACIEHLVKGGATDLVRYPDYRTMIGAVLAGDVKILCMDEHPAAYYLYRLDPGKRLRRAFQLYQGQFHRAVRHDDAVTLDAVERGMALITADELDALHDKWFGAPVGTALGPFLRFAGYFISGLAVVVLFLLLWLQSMRTAVRHKTAALEQERARFETLFQTLPDAVWLKDPSGVTLACNREFERLLGRPASDLVGRADEELVGVATAASFRESDRRAMQSDGPATVEEWLDLSGTGRPRLFRTTRTTMRDAAGRLLGVLGVGRDVTDQHETQVALGERVKEQRCLHAVFRATEDPAKPLPAMLDAVVEQLPPGWCYPDVAAACIEWDGRRHETSTFAAVVAVIGADIRLDGVVRGRVTVGYVAECPPASEGPFLAEERVLVDAVADRLASVVQRRIADERLRDSEERFRRLFEDTRQAITLYENGRFIAANRAALDMLGMERLDQLLGLTPFDISPPFQPDGRSSADGAAALTAIAVERGWNDFEWQHRRVDGGLFFVRVVITVVPRSEGDLFHAVWTDITEQKRVEAELAEYRRDLERKVDARTAEVVAATEQLRAASEERQAVFDAANVGIVLIRDGRIVHCNRTLERMLGREPGELDGLSTRVAYVDDEAFERSGEQIAQAFAAQGFHREELEMVRRDGSRFWSRLMMQPIDRDQPEKGFAGTIEDITAERAVIAEMARARALAEDAARTKADFLANMSHEIRTPMNAVIGMTHLVLGTDLAPRQRDYVRKILSSSRMLLGILNDILDFSKIDAGKLVVERVDFELDHVLDDVTGMVAERTAAKGLELLVDVADDVPAHLAGDPLRIGQILANYANNAVKFTERGEIVVRVEVASRDGDDVRLRFSVRDTGVGIDDVQRARLFRSFEQADTSITRRFGGTGLGLAISKRLAELMGGEVGVESVPGRGSTFWFTVALGAGRDARERFLPRADLRGRRVLVVDDNETALEIIGDELRRMTFVVATAGSGEGAIAELLRAETAGEPCELVFLDWQMPGMDGIETAARIRRLGLRSAPRLVMITAYGRDDLVPDATRVGIAEILAKPVTPSHLFDAAMRVLGADEAARHQPRTDAAALPDVSALAGARVLLVEDNDLNREVAAEFLHEAGLEVDVAPDGAVAVEKVGQNRYDLVLMDMQMPVMDGLAATREIRRRPALRDLPIVAMTANAMASDRERCIDAGMNDHLSKPIDPATFVAALLRWVPARAGRQAAAPAVGAPVSAHVLDGIDGLDVALGLSLVGHRDALYLSILEKFVAGQADAPARIALAIAASDWTAAEREAHTLKGVAAQIGADGIRALADRLEHAIRAREPVARLDELRAGIAAPLAALVAAIATRLPRSAAAEPAGATFDVDRLRELCVALAARLHADDFTSRTLLEDNESLLRAGLGGGFAGVAEAVRAYDFAAALDRLDAAARPRGIVLQ